MSNAKDTQGQLWEVFIQASPGIPHKHSGSVHATDKEMALQNARDLYTRRSEGTSIWVVPSAAIVASAPQDSGMKYDNSNDKPYPQPTIYVMPEGAKNI